MECYEHMTDSWSSLSAPRQRRYNHCAVSLDEYIYVIGGTYVCIYIQHISLIVSRRFTILLLGEIERQLVKAPLATAISPYLISPTHPTHAWRDRPPYQELRPLLFSISVFRC